MGFIYLLQREADIRYRSYKIGRTTRFITDRIHGSPDYRRATIYVVRLVRDVELVERILIDTFKDKFVQTCTQYSEFGIEDFICDVRQAIAIVNEICDQYIPVAQPPPVPLAQDVQPNPQPVRTEKPINGLTKEADILPKPDKHGWIVPDDDCELKVSDEPNVGASVKLESEPTTHDLNPEPTQSSFNFKPSTSPSSGTSQSQSKLSKEWDEWQAKESMKESRQGEQTDVKNDEVNEQSKSKTDTKPKAKTSKRATKSKKVLESSSSDTQKEPEKPKSAKPKAKKTKKVKQVVEENIIPSVPQTSNTSSILFGFTHSSNLSPPSSTAFNPWQNNSNASLFTGLVKDETIGIPQYGMVNPPVATSSDKPILQSAESTVNTKSQSQSPPPLEQGISDNEIPDEPVHQKRGANYARFVEIQFSVFKDIFRCYDENLYEIMMFGMFSKYYPHIQVVVSPAYTEGHHERPKYCCKIADVVKITDIRYTPHDFEHIQSISLSNISDPYLVAVIQINVKNGYVVCVSDQPMFNPVNIKMYYLPNIGLRQEIAAREYDGILTTPVKLHVSKVGKSWNYSINYV